MRRTVLSGTAAALFFLALTGCSSGSSEAAGPGSGAGDPQVASLAEPSSAGPTPKKQDERPRERLDTTPEEFEQLLKPYYDCMDEKGIDASRFKEMMAKRGQEGQDQKIEEYQEADAICNPQYWPLPPWEKDPANPDAREFAQDVVACLKEKGVEYVEVDKDGISLSLGGKQNDMPSITKGMELAPECEREVAAQK